MVIESSSATHRILERIACLDVGLLSWNEPLRNHCSWRIGGPADLLVEPVNVRQVKTLVRAVGETGIPFVVIGQGTNLLFADEGVRGVVMKIGGRMADIDIKGTRVVAEAGVWVPCFARVTAKAGISSFEHIAGIPGTLGGLVLMNGGSQRKSIGDAVKCVWVVTRQGDEVRLDREECKFSYRNSDMQANGAVVVKCELHGVSRDPKEIRRDMLGILQDRRMKFPLRQPNCGSVFLSSPELHKVYGSPGKIIEKAGMKELRVGDAQVSRKHANFIVNLGNATADDVLKLIERINCKLQKNIGSKLICEVQYVNSNGKKVKASEGSFCRGQK